MSHKKRTRRITDIMPMRKVEKPFEKPIAPSSKGRKPTRYELDLRAREEKKKRKRKGLPSGSRANEGIDNKTVAIKSSVDPRLGSRKKVPLMVEFVNQPEKGRVIKPIVPTNIEAPRLSPELELEQLENNEALNQLLDDLDAGKTLSKRDQAFVDECLDRVHELMVELGIEAEEEDEDHLLRQFERIDINQFK
ncbi:hypothetical protein EV693_11918 [Nicoletella semolina]|uniref:Der GTPase-activating protein YihI n=1 Tax=Nicoletella semolina TaxID=271160 RepID=A0A4R2N428_9PAST|nr:Der GTPase-activating protein YihI [Nicoletella semolina]MDH2925228.1 GTPase-activating protein [Nicoletella semolina]TCP15308.1 hypothetical protein EV693_11918 [Nicoletella semolina]